MESVLIGEVLKPQGFKGELKIYPYTNDVNRFKNLSEVILTDGKISVVFKVENVHVDIKEIVFLKLEGIDTKEECEKYRKYEVRVKLEDVPPLKDRWYYFELEGMQVFENDVLLGTLTKILETGANDVYIVEGEKGLICVPALKSVVKKVDVLSKRMDVVLPLGLLDD
ncbi:MAG: ribosome maturation factor RimM [Eubacteriales bacterium]